MNNTRSHRWDARNHKRKHIRQKTEGMNLKKNKQKGGAIRGKTYGRNHKRKKQER
jgi:hypothetical protein